MRRERGQCRQGEMVTRGRPRTPRPTHSPELLLGPSGCWPSPHAEVGRIGAKLRPVCSEHRGWGQGPRFAGLRSESAGDGRPCQPPLPFAPFRGAAPALRAARGPTSGPAPRSFGLGWSEEPGEMARVQGRGLNDRTPRPRHPRLLSVSSRLCPL